MLGDSEPVGVAISHARPDHVGALAEIRAKPGVPVLTHLAPDETLCYPGHGPSLWLGDKRAAIEAFLTKDHGDFCGDAT
jgi:glyoxylase-like metal-dependent hydrolase (beta-lactamase superfamily II)